MVFGTTLNGVEVRGGGVGLLPIRNDKDTPSENVMSAPIIASEGEMMMRALDELSTQLSICHAEKHEVTPNL